MPEQQPAPFAPEALLVGLGLESIDVTDVVTALNRRGLAVTDDDAHIAGHRAHSAELVVEVDPDRRGLGHSASRGAHGEEDEAEHHAEKPHPTQCVK